MQTGYFGDAGGPIRGQAPAPGSDTAIEQEIQPKGKTAPRITPSQRQAQFPGPLSESAILDIWQYQLAIDGMDGDKAVVNTVHQVLAQVDGLGFGAALRALKAGKRVARAGWNGKGMWLALTGKGGSWNGTIEGGAMPADWQGFLPFIGMYTADCHFVPWLASQTDVLAEDWQTVE